MAQDATFRELFMNTGAFSSVFLDHCGNVPIMARAYFPNLEKQTEIYIARHKDLSPLCLELLHKNAMLQGPLYFLLRDYLWARVCHMRPLHSLMDILTAIIQLGKMCTF